MSKLDDIAENVIFVKNIKLIISNARILKVTY